MTYGESSLIDQIDGDPETVCRAYGQPPAVESDETLAAIERLISRRRATENDPCKRGAHDRADRPDRGRTTEPLRGVRRAASAQIDGSEGGSMNNTPGPWSILQERGQSQVRTVIAGEFQVCDCVGLTPDGDAEGSDLYAGVEVNLANARLIAAAPDLLEASKLALQLIGGSEITVETTVETLSKLSAAIKKAQGNK
jgi:hypothetical protein